MNNTISTIAVPLNNDTVAAVVRFRMPEIVLDTEWIENEVKDLGKEQALELVDTLVKGRTQYVNPKISEISFLTESGGGVSALLPSSLAALNEAIERVRKSESKCFKEAEIKAAYLEYVSSLYPDPD